MQQRVAHTDIGKSHLVVFRCAAGIEVGAHGSQVRSCRHSMLIDGVTMDCQHVATSPASPPVHCSPARTHWPTVASLPAGHNTPGCQGPDSARRPLPAQRRHAQRAAQWLQCAAHPPPHHCLRLQAGWHTGGRITAGAARCQGGTHAMTGTSVCGKGSALPHAAKLRARQHASCRVAHRAQVMHMHMPWG